MTVDIAALKQANPLGAVVQRMTGQPVVRHKIRARNVRRNARRTLQSHDFWCWFYGAVVLCTLIVLEVMRAHR